MEDINLAFTGDMSAIESANNLLCAAIDNHIYFGNELEIEKVTFERCVDVNDRALRKVTTDFGKTCFTITAASEIMALLCLAKDIEDLKAACEHDYDYVAISFTRNTDDIMQVRKDIEDLKEKIGNIIIGYNKNNNPVYAKELKVEGAMTVLLKDAIKPNLVQTLENTPAIVHGGPFANIAHGCNSLIATNTALSVADYVITEAGFGSDLGAEKFFDIKCRKGNIKPDCVVLVTTIKSLKYNAGVEKEDILLENVEKVKEGLPNLLVHIENIQKFSKNIVVALNKYSTDSVEEINVIKELCEKKNIPFEISTAYIDGGEGAVNLAEKVLDVLKNENDFQFIYEDNDDIKTKIEKVSTEVYRANKVEYTEEVLKKIDNLEQKNLSNLPICVAKTQYSLSEDSKKLGDGYEHTIHVRDIKVYSGAGFIVIYLGSIITMPALSKNPNYLNIDFVDNNIIGLS